MKKLRKTLWLGPACPSSDDIEVDGIHLQVYESKSEESFLYEFGIVLVQFRDGGYAMQARVFSDSWTAFEDCPEVFKIMGSMNHCFRDLGRKDATPFEELVEKLKKAGWHDEGRKQSRFYKTCSQCHQEVPAR